MIYGRGSSKDICAQQRKKAHSMTALPLFASFSSSPGPGSSAIMPQLISQFIYIRGYFLRFIFQK
jgi:hypothetical protein